MYLWVVIATFIAILYSYGLPVRPDMDRVFAESRAGVALTKFRALHNGVSGYFTSQSPEKTGQTYVTYYPGDGVNVSTAGNVALGVEQIYKFLPVGYAQNSDSMEDVASISGGGKIVSKVFCFNEGDTTKSCVSGGDGSCCSSSCSSDSGCTGIYVVSFTQLPSRWINKVSNMPNADMMGAFTKIQGYGKNFGYTETVNGKRVISSGYSKREALDAGQGHKQIFEYREIFPAVLNDPDFQELGCDRNNVYCLYAVQQIYG